ncbi:ABC transporter ATP-binding protein [Flavobacterium sp. xlx-214]|uniref:ABC transporter ATP-binding protein n=1 Tax=unclassified Flavobacterium TaxID=196869 RepID=UPI0013D0CD96|nr:MULTISPECIES: ABC transporter ATP-binding protein [unclassified Flavobacterium]MBA5792548.1 ABC transporter ATP-binding protein [Flavobacterium sp. xlx-221]QMI82302.1 ABC transporter ATP-binding protein [Flavobacterium sp. xlx-214]
MTKHELRVQEVMHFFDNKDILLGFRKMLDCVIDTQDMSLYQEAIALTDWKEKNPTQTDAFITKAKELLVKVGKVAVAENNHTSFVLQAKDITKSYGSQKFSLGPISLTLSKGQVFGLVGENGNGKTTLLRILAKEIAQTQGTLDYSFTNKVNNTYDLRTKLIYIPQRTDKWYGSLMDNLRFVLANYGEKPEEIETRVLLMVARLGLWNYKHLKWSELSSGYKMRFELARTLLRKPEILLLDEPLANLDVLAQQIILEDLKAIANSINNPIALILSSQQLYEVEKISDKVIFLKNGKYNEAANTVDETEEKPLIIEIDTDANRDVLLNILSPYALDKLTYNGGIYTAYFATSTRFSSVIIALGQAEINLIYIRDISASTRRFFVN